MSNRKDRVGIVYSTNPDYAYQYADEQTEVDTLQPSDQRLRVRIERSGRGGKTVTIVDKFVGTEADLESLGKLLKSRCGVGGSVKDGQIIVQGDFRERVVTLLQGLGYTQTK